MHYLTYEEFKDIMSGTEITETQFNEELPKAEIQIDAVTHYFYAGGLHDLNDDVKSNKKFRYRRASAFKQALCLIIDFAIQTGVTNSNDVVSGDVKSISIGRTHIETNGASATYGRTAVPDEAISILAYWGLMYRGVPYR